jgi:hypothetical protein
MPRPERKTFVLTTSGSRGISAQRWCQQHARENHRDPDRGGAHGDLYYHPEQGGPFAPVVIYMDVWGLREELYDIARRVAVVGYYVLLPDLDYRQGRIRHQWRNERGILENVPSPIVFDHLAHIPEPEGVSHPLFGKVRALIDKGKTWVKLSGAYADTKVGPPTYADSTAVAQAYAKAAPERCVWGSDWPHPGEREKKPDDAILFDLLLVWAPDETVRHRILVENPAVLYDYPKST